MHIYRCTVPPRPARSATAVLWAVAVVGLTWLVPTAAHAQDSGLFSAVHDDAAQPQSPASLDATAPTFSGGDSLSERLIGELLGTLTLVANGETVAGAVRMLGGTYRIRSARVGPHAISEVEEPPPDCEVLEPQGRVQRGDRRLQEGAQALGRQR